MPVSVYFGFDDPQNDPVMKARLELFEPTVFMLRSNEEAKKWDLFYQPQPSDFNEMEFNYQKELNPSSYILRILEVFRVYDRNNPKKESLYYTAAKQVRSPPPNEKMPGKEHTFQGYFGWHVKPNVVVEGFTYRGKPVNPRVESTEWVFDIAWSKSELDKLINDSDNKTSDTMFYVAEAPLTTGRQTPNPMFRVVSKNDFMDGDIHDLIEMGKSRTTFKDLGEYQETKVAQKRMMTNTNPVGGQITKRAQGQ